MVLTIRQLFEANRSLARLITLDEEGHATTQDMQRIERETLEHVGTAEFYLPQPTEKRGKDLVFLCNNSALRKTNTYLTTREAQLLLGHDAPLARQRGDIHIAAMLAAQTHAPLDANAYTLEGTPLSEEQVIKDQGLMFLAEYYKIPTDIHKKTQILPEGRSVTRAYEIVGVKLLGS